VISKLSVSALLSLIHRFVTAPIARAVLFTVLVTISKYGPCCDLCLLLKPAILPTGQIKNPDGSTMQRMGSNDMGNEEGGMDLAMD